LLCATHDVEETQTFSRVLMIEGGELVEDGSPDALKVHTKYRSLLAAEHRVRDGLSSSHLWRRWRVGNGRIEESPASLTRTSAS
jgi:ABC-type multidrug transport system ATPase subunit